jgi:hypothetical protein
MLRIMSIDYVNLATLVAVAAARSIWSIARRPILLLTATLVFVISAAASLTLSGLVFTGWWQGFFLELGVGLLIAGIVDIAILGALHGLIEGEGDGETTAIYQLTAAVNRVETLLKTPGAATGQSASTGEVG